MHSPNGYTLNCVAVVQDESAYVASAKYPTVTAPIGVGNCVGETDGCAVGACVGSCDGPVGLGLGLDVGNSSVQLSF